MANFSDGTSNLNMTQSTQNQAKTFADITKARNQHRPNRNQAIIIETIPTIATEEFIYAVGDIINPTNIISVSKIYNQRLCVFLNSKELVEKIVTENPEIVVQGQKITIRRYVNPYLRVIISHAYTSIPNCLIEDALINCGITPKSPITTLRAGLKREGYGHIESFRRQIFVAPKENNDTPIEIPETITINYDDTEYKLYLTTDVTCFICKQKGHIASKCKNKTTQNTEEPRPNPLQDSIDRNEDTNHSQKTNSTISTSDQTLHTISQNTENHDDTPQNSQTLQCLITNFENNNQSNLTQSNPSTDETPLIEVNNMETSKKIKRNARSISSLDEELTQTQMDPPPEDNKDNNKSKKQKKKRTDSPGNEINLNDILQPFKNEMDSNPKLYSISYEDLYNLTEQIQTSSTPLTIARKFTNDIYELIVLLKDLHTFTNNRSAKTKITKIINKLREDMMEEADNASPS